MKIKFIIFSVLITFVTDYSQGIELSTPNGYKNIEIIYNLPDYLHPRIIIYSDSLKSRAISEHAIEEDILRPSKRLRETNWKEEWRKDGRDPRVEKKQFQEAMLVRDYLISAYAKNEGTDHSLDILIWKTDGNSFSLKSLYPYFAGGGLYCQTKLTINQDTVIFKTSGSDAEDIYGEDTYHILKNDSLITLKIVRFSGYKYDNKYSMCYKYYYYNKNEEITDTDIDFISTIDGKTQYVYSLHDSLRLHLLRADYEPLNPKYLMTVYLKDDSLKYGQTGGYIAAVNWRGAWYAVYQKDIYFKSKDK